MNIELMQSRFFLEGNFKKGIPREKVESGCGETSKVVVEGEASEAHWR